MKKAEIIQFCGDVVSRLSRSGRIASQEFKDKFAQIMCGDTHDYLCGYGRYRDLYLPLCAMANDFARLDHIGMMEQTVMYDNVECIEINDGVFLFLFHGEEVSNKADVILNIPIDYYTTKSLSNSRHGAIIFDAFQEHVPSDNYPSAEDRTHYVMPDNTGVTITTPVKTRRNKNSSNFYSEMSTYREAQILVGYTNGYSRNGVVLTQEYTDELIADNSASRLSDAMCTCNIPNKEYREYYTALEGRRYFSSHCNRMFIKNSRIMR